MSYLLKMTLIFIGTFLFYRLVRLLAQLVEKALMRLFPSFEPQLHLLGMRLPYGMQMPITGRRQRVFQRSIVALFIIGLLAVLYFVGAFEPLA